VPGLATLYTYSALANVMAIPFLIATAAATATMVSAPSARRIILTGFLYAAATSLYMEFAPILAAIGAAAAVFAVLLGRCSRWQAVASVVAAVLLFAMFYPKVASAAVYRVVLRVSVPTKVGNPMGWIQNDQMFGTVWVYDSWGVDPPVTRRWNVNAVGVALSALGAIGLLRIGFGAFRRPPQGESNASGVMALLTVCMAVAPVLLFFDENHQYQAMKLTLSLAPLWVVGITFALRVPEWLRGRMESPKWLPVRRAGLVPITCALLVCLYGTTSLIYRLTSSRPAPRSAHHAAIDKSFQLLKHTLRSIPKDNVVLGVGGGLFDNGELSFAARRHNVWLACPLINDGMCVGCTKADPPYRPFPPGRQLVDLTTVPAGALVVTVDSPAAPLLIEGDKTLLREVGPYRIWRLGPGPVQLIATEYARRPPELDHPSPQKANAK
jgi:hypothetical protein